MIVGDANQDANTYNDRFPGVSRNAFNGPDYATTDFRLTRLIPLRSRLRLEAMVEAFNVFNRTNRRVVITDDGFLNTAGNFVPIDQTVGVSHYPAYYTRSSTFLYANDVFAPRQVQLALKVIF